MNKDECERLVEAYVQWLRTGLSAQRVEQACELTTPFMDRHNDHVQIYAVKKDGKIEISDDGYTLADLEQSGVDLSTPKRRLVLDSVLNGFGVRRVNDQILAEASPSNVGQKLHSVVQAILAVSDMFVMAQPRVASFFWEDVRSFLTEHDIRHCPRVRLAGRSGFDHSIDFLIPRSKTRPERLVQAINAPNKNTIGTYLFALSDTREARGEESEAYAFLNDLGRPVSGEVVEALQVYQVKPVLWSRRNNYRKALAA